MKFLFLPLLLPLATAFDCYTCNSMPSDDDTQPCVDKVETCLDGVESCSMSMYITDEDNKMHLRKFCTNSGTPIYQYLLFFPGSSICQNIQTKNTNMKRSDELEPPPLLVGDLLEKRRKRSNAMPPAPPNSQASNLLCVCTTELCNAGTYDEVLKHSMLKNIDEKLGLIKESGDNLVQGF